MWEHMIAWLPNWKAKIYDYIRQSLKSTVLILSKMHLTVYVLPTYIVNAKNRIMSAKFLNPRTLIK